MVHFIFFDHSVTLQSFNKTAEDLIDVIHVGQLNM
jgi:hypothetical protein